MILIATIPAPHQRSFAAVAENEFVKEVRFNTGVSVPDSPKVTLEKILEATRGEKKIWIDLKGRQLRITQWADPTFCHVELSHCIEVELPARIYFRGSHYAQIQEVRGNRLFLHDQPSEALGKGQSVNVHGANLRISGYLTSQDKEYIEAAKSLGLHDYMLSFVEQEFDIIDLLQLDPAANIVAKIESPLGLKFVEKIYPAYRQAVHLMAARDDLFINIGEPKIAAMNAIKSIVKADPEAIVASRLLSSLCGRDGLSLSDLSDLYLMRDWGYQRFMLSDGLSAKVDPFLEAVSVMQSFTSQTGGDS